MKAEWNNGRQTTDTDRKTITLIGIQGSYRNGKTVSGYTAEQQAACGGFSGGDDAAVADGRRKPSAAGASDGTHTAGVGQNLWLSGQCGRQ